MNAPVARAARPWTRLRRRLDHGRAARATMLSVALALGLVMSPAMAQYGTPAPAQKNDNVAPPLLAGIGIDQKLGDTVPLDLVFNDASGKPVKLGELLDGRPVVLSLVYYGCPMLCTVVLNNQLRGFAGLPTQTIGKDYDVITVSFDPRETSELAGKKHKHYLHAYARGNAAEKWHFLTGSEESIKRLTDAVGFRYKWDETSQQFLHPSGLMVLTPQGKIARYFFGIDYEPKDLRLTLVEAGEGKIGTLTDHIMLFCYHYDAKTGKYGLAVTRMVQTGGVITLLAIGSGLTYLIRKDRRAKARSSSSGTET
jgi:protein SCO1